LPFLLNLHFPSKLVVLRSIVGQYNAYGVSIDSESCKGLSLNYAQAPLDEKSICMGFSFMAQIPFA
jgi:hypothetical protein